MLSYTTFRDTTLNITLVFYLEVNFVGTMIHLLMRL